MTGALERPSVADAVGGSAQALADRTAADVLAGLGHGPDQDSGIPCRVRELAYQVILETLAAADPDGRPGDGGDAPAAPPGLPPEVAREVCRAASARAWQALVDQADDLDSARLLRAAPSVFARAQLLQAAGVDPGPAAVTSDRRDARETVTRALLLGEPAGTPAARLGVRLAPSYAVVLMSPDPVPGRLRADQHDILTAEVGDRTLILLPILFPVQRIELSGFCEQLLDRAVTGTDDGNPRIAAALAQTHDRIPLAADEARTVDRITVALDFPSGVYQLADVPVEAALTRSPDLVSLLASRLTPLHGSGAALMHTLRVYQDHGLDRRRAAQALDIHPNSLDYRLRRIRELTGLSPTVPRDIQTLAAAITAWRLTHGSAQDTV